MVNAAGQRFYDEGEELWPKRYAIWGRNIAGQPGQIAYSLWDAKVRRTVPAARCTARPRRRLDRRARRPLGLDAHAVAPRSTEFNAAVTPGGTFDPPRLDDCATEGLHPPKSHWARRIDTPALLRDRACGPGSPSPTSASPSTEQARVLRADGRPFANVFAAGEIMSGNILSTGYLAGFGLTIGSVWGRIAGRARPHARRRP